MSATHLKADSCCLIHEKIDNLSSFLSANSHLFQFEQTCWLPRVFCAFSKASLLEGKSLTCIASIFNCSVSTFVWPRFVHIWTSVGACRARATLVCRSCRHLGTF